MSLEKSIIEAIGTELVKVIKGEILKTEPLNLPAAISSVITKNKGNIPNESIQIDAKIFLKIGLFEGSIEISYPPLSVK
jgi:hypothetical protein